jgi:hypothetical protein
MKLRAGLKLQSAVSKTQLVVVRAGNADIEIACGGVMVLEDGAAPDGATLDAPIVERRKLGKRYADEELGLELLCTRAGEGALTIDGRVLPDRAAKRLPSSD